MPDPAVVVPVAQKHHFDWLNFLVLSGAVAVNTIGAAEVAAPGTVPFISPAVDVALFNGLVSALRASKAD